MWLCALHVYHHRQSTVNTARCTAGAISDGDKIRKQLQLDVAALVANARTLGVDVTSLEVHVQLVKRLEGS